MAKKQSTVPDTAVDTQLSAQPETIAIPSIDVRTIQIRLVGDSPLICHAWSKKAQTEMLDKQMKKAKTAKVAKDPHQDFLDSLYPHPDGGYGFPCVAFKAAGVSGCRFTEGVKMTTARGAFHVVGELARIEGDEPTMRQDMVRVGMGTADIRFRGEFKHWAVTLTIAYNASVISAEQIGNLYRLAGFGIGIGEWRPERDGSYGRFHVE